MKHIGIKTAAAGLAIFILSGINTAHAGWVLTETNGDETVISQGKMKTTWENGAVILDAGKNKIFFLDDRRKIIAGGTVDELCEGIKQMVESMMAAIPAEQREMMKQMMGNTDSSIEVVDKGSGGKVAGFETTKYEVIADGVLYEQIWLATDESLTKECQGLMIMLMKFSSCMSSVNSMGAPVPESSPEYMKLFEKGVIVKVVEHGDEGEGVNTTVISSRDVSSSVFNLPIDYEEVPVSKLWGDEE